MAKCINNTNTSVCIVYTLPALYLMYNVNSIKSQTKLVWPINLLICKHIAFYLAIARVLQRSLKVYKIKSIKSLLALT